MTPLVGMTQFCGTSCWKGPNLVESTPPYGTSGWEVLEDQCMVSAPLWGYQRLGGTLFGSDLDAQLAHAHKWMMPTRG